MSVSEQIKKDYVTLKNFASKHDINYRVLINTLSGRTEYTSTINKLIELGYIRSKIDLKR